MSGPHCKVSPELGDVNPPYPFEWDTLTFASSTDSGIERSSYFGISLTCPRAGPEPVWPRSTHTLFLVVLVIEGSLQAVAGNARSVLGGTCRRVPPRTGASVSGDGLETTPNQNNKNNNNNNNKSACLGDRTGASPARGHVAKI